MVDGEITINTKLQTRDFDREIRNVENKLQRLENDYEEIKQAKPFDGQKETLSQLSREILKTKKHLNSLVKEKDKFVKDKFNGISLSIGNVGNGLEKVIKKVTRWGLALFGIRSMYNFIRQSASTLSQYDKQMATDIEYIRFALATTLKPIIQWILDAVAKLMYYVNYIWAKWFGKPLFKDAGAKAFADANKQAQKLKNTLTDFDEVRTLNAKEDDGIKTPSFDLSNMQDVEIPWWIDWIANNKDTILKIGEVFAGLFVASKVAGWLGLIGKLIGGKTSGLNGILTALMAIAAYELIKIDVQLIKDATKQYNELADSISNLATKGEKAIEVEKALQEASTNTQTSTEDLDTIFQHYTRSISLNTDIIKSNKGAIDNLSFTESILDAAILGTNGTVYQSTKNIAENSEEIRKNIDQLNRMRDAGNLTTEQEEKYRDALEKLIPQLESQMDGLVEGTDAYTNMKYAIQIAKETLDKFNNTNVKNKAATIDVTANVTSFKQAIDRAVKYAEQKLGGLGFSAGGGGNIGGSGGGFRAKGGLYHPSMLPKLAVGGIINNPGPGVPYHGATIAEAGAEAVVPLTDSQQMSLLGETIGKYITVELTNITELDGRQIARKVNKIQQDENFVLNR